MTSVRKYLSELSLGERTVFKNLTMFGLEGVSVGKLDYLTLADAMKLEVVRVSEISDGGSVPELLFENSADLPVLILDGEELLGAKQNRTVNLTILVPAGKTVKTSEFPPPRTERGPSSRRTPHCKHSTEYPQEWPPGSTPYGRNGHGMPVGPRVTRCCGAGLGLLALPGR